MVALSPLLTFALALALASPAFAQQGNYTVWSTVIFQRTGERTPSIIGNGTEGVVLTSLGQNQAFAAGSYFRNRYIAAAHGQSNGTNGADGMGGPLAGLSSDRIDNFQSYAISLDQQFNIATAMAWFQGFYPPSMLNSSTNFGEGLDPNNLVVVDENGDYNATYLDGPLGGYQFPQLHVAGAYDPNYVYLGANLLCPAFDGAAAEYTQTPNYEATQAQFKGIYAAIGSAVFEGLLPSNNWDYLNAYAIYDWLQYQYLHNETIAEILDRYTNPQTNISNLSILRWLADEQQYAQLGNLSAVNPFNGNNYLPNVMYGSISTIAGNMFAAKALGMLQQAIDYQSVGWYKLNVLFADYEPLMSFVALMGLPNLNSNFYGIPEFGASAAFELFSHITDENPGFPERADDLWVKFYFRNGTDESDPYLAYPLFNRGPDETAMTWLDFQNSMYTVVMGDVGEWCTACGAQNLFCDAYNATNNPDGRIWFNGDVYTITKGMSPVVAGVVGAVVSLAVAALLFALVMLLFGVRFHRNRSPKSDLGGFKGGQKMASDQDLTIPKGGAIVGASFENNEPMSPVTGGHERVGSWELKQGQPEHGNGNLEAGMRPSMEQARRTPDISEGVRPVRPLERV